MTTKKKQPSIWKCQDRRGGFEWTASLIAYWEVELDPISDDFTPEEISAPELFSRWARRVRAKHSNGLIPIHWFVDVKGEHAATFEYMPFQFEHFHREKHEDFLTFFT